MKRRTLLDQAWTWVLRYKRKNNIGFWTSLNAETAYIAGYRAAQRDQRKLIGELKPRDLYVLANRRKR